MTATSATGPAGATTSPRASGFWPVLLCWIAVALDGYDLVVLGAVIPTLDKTGALGFDTASLTTAATLGLVGVGIGAVTIGPLTDRFGRRVSLISCIALFSVLTLATAFAPSSTVFIVLRFLAGLGLGACLPTALTFMSEYAGDRSASSAMTRTMTGYHVGAVLTALLALWVIPDFGWEAMFVIGGVAGLLVVPLMWAKLPESEAFLAASRDRTTRVTPSDVVRGRLLMVSIGLWVASFMGLLLVYGLNTWLPRIMEEAGYSLDAGLTLLLTLNVGAVLGLLVSGRVADARGNKVAVAGLVQRRGRRSRADGRQGRQLAAGVRRGAGRRLLRVQRAGARVRVRRAPLPARDPRHRARHGRRGRPGRRDRRAVPRRRAGHRRGGVSVGLLRVRRGRRPGGGSAGAGAGPPVTAGRLRPDGLPERRGTTVGPVVFTRQTETSSTTTPER